LQKLAAEPQAWTVEDAVEIYNINRWGTNYFSVNPNGLMTCSPTEDAGASIEILDVVQEALGRGMRMPLLIRFQDLLRHRVERINQAFSQAIAENKYNGKYMGVFPIKVNQLREVVEEILDAGRPFQYGLEAGSKPELMAALSIHNSPDSLIVCNGYKDNQFIRMALLGNKLNKKVVMVAEKLTEVQAIIRMSKELNVEPIVGIRVRLLAKGEGKWATSAGENAKFGLSTTDLLEAVHLLREAGLGHTFKLLHFHIGSQVPNIFTIKRAVREATRFYAKLQKMGCNLEFIDVGGGLGVDYDGSRSSFHSSTNYSLQEYANDIVYNILDICDEEGVRHPNIVSESGRAIVAHHSVLVVDTFGQIEKVKNTQPFSTEARGHKLIRDLQFIEKNMARRDLREAYHDLLQLKEEAQAMFNLGLLDLDIKADVETTFWHLAKDVLRRYRANNPEFIHEEMKELENQLADQFLLNFSVFQSLLDHWALGQLFPIVPIHRLDENPVRRATLVDITCDSDGKVSKFIDQLDVRDTLPLHHPNGKPYYVGFFMTGAYQDIMGDLHNLFGRVNEAHVFLDPDEEDGWYIEETIDGSTIEQVLRLTQYHENDLVRGFKGQVDAAIKGDRVKPNEGMRLLNEYEKTLKDYTYLKFPPESE
jgi:arginine decarboxylase